MSSINESAGDVIPENVTWSDRPEPELHVVLVQFASILLLSVVCISGNLLLLTIVCRTRPLRTISNALIVNLSVADLLTATLVLPAFSVSVFQPDSVSSQDSVCTVIGLVTQLLSMETMSTLGSIALDRYFNICHPLRYQAMVTKPKMALVVGMTWVQSSVLALLPVCGFGRYRFRSAILPLCSLDLLSNRAFSFLVLGVVIAPSFFVVGVCYGSILKAARVQAKKIFDMELVNARVQLSSWRTRGLAQGRVAIGRGRRRRRRRSATVNAVHPTGVAAAAGAAAASKAPDRARSPVEAWRSAAVRMMEDPESLWMRAVTKIRKTMKQVRAAKTVVIIIGGYVSCWVPYVIVLVVTLVRREYVTGYVINFVVTFLAFSSCFVDPLICIFVNRDFWTGFKAVLGLRRRARVRTAATVFAGSASAASVAGGGGGQRDKRVSPPMGSSDALQWNSFRKKWNDLRRTDASPVGVLEKKG